jgi:hypothetical protein
MAALTFIALVGLAAGTALIDYRKGWYAAILIGVLQDPARKLIPGHPAILVLTVMVVYAAIIVGAAPLLESGAYYFRRRYRNIDRLLPLLAVVLIIAAVNGMVTFGVSQWEAPALSLFIYCAPIPAIIFGYVFTRNEEDLIRFLKFYSALTSIALISVPLEYLRVNSPVLGTVALGEDWIRHLPGLQVRILSGTYRSPDIMAWHAAMLAMIALFMIIRRGFPRGWLWMVTFAWGFLNCLLSGRRKMLYMIAVFVVVLLWKYWRRFTVAQMVSFALAIGLVWLVVNQISTSSEGTQVYAKGARTTRGEILQRLEGGIMETFRQNGLMGAGLGSATQGTRHVVRPGANLGWQEGGAGKLALELGLPGLLFAIWFLVVLARTMTRIAFTRDVGGDFQMIRIALIAFLAGNFVSFLVSHQPYSDGVLVLMNAFLAGALFATPRFNEGSEPSMETQPVSSALAPSRPQIAKSRIREFAK